MHCSTLRWWRFLSLFAACLCLSGVYDCCLYLLFTSVWCWPLCVLFMCLSPLCGCLSVHTFPLYVRLPILLSVYLLFLFFLSISLLIYKNIHINKNINTCTYNYLCKSTYKKAYINIYAYKNLYI